MSDLQKKLSSHICDEVEFSFSFLRERERERERERTSLSHIVKDRIQAILFDSYLHGYGGGFKTLIKRSPRPKSEGVNVTFNSRQNPRTSLFTETTLIKLKNVNL
jgi:hypothetical protein